jgi:Flp pilus assembly protein TadB
MGRMSAYTLIGLPFVLALAISVLNRGYLHPLFYSSAGHMLLAIGLGMMLVAPRSSRRSSPSKVDTDADTAHPRCRLPLARRALRGQCRDPAGAQPAGAHPHSRNVRSRPRLCGPDRARFNDRVLAPLSPGSRGRCYA